ncbi:putative archaeal/bacterial/fungal rhodopsin, rhodopsin, retinal binding protein [Septoria linicola]|nr:putative archaeal/bacterial/fungal rhodopsin, rhodopsin, retinal binding protein [Septoria linicola]
MCFVFFVLLFRGRKYARHLGNDISRTYTLSLVWTLLVWICYPICWGVSEGGNIIALDSEAVYYGVLDMFAKPFFSMMFLFSVRKVEPARLGLRFRDYDEDFVAYKRHDGHHRDGDGGLSGTTEAPLTATPALGNGVRPTTAGSQRSALNHGPAAPATVTPAANTAV